MTSAEQRRFWASAALEDPRLEVLLPKLRERLLSHSFASSEVLTSAFNLCRQLALEPDRYGIIISDEASGRLVSLLVKQVLDRLREKEGLPALPLLFLNGGMLTGSSLTAVRACLEQNRNRLVRPLITTEYIESGESMSQFLGLFNEQSIYPEVACLSLSQDPEKYRKKIPARIIYGSIGTAGAWVYANYSEAGVKKDYFGAHPARLKDLQNDSDDRREVQYRVSLARADVALLTETFSANILR